MIYAIISSDIFIIYTSKYFNSKHSIKKTVKFVDYGI
jgi:hypothetical protein